jgi:hypothetical protein
MDSATIGDDLGEPVYEFDWGDQTRTTEEIGDLDEAGFEADIDDVVSVARDDPDCEVRVIGFGG